VLAIACVHPLAISEVDVTRVIETPVITPCKDSPVSRPRFSFVQNECYCSRVYLCRSWWSENGSVNDTRHGMRMVRPRCL
jgi:hypothetical protein